MGNVNVSECCAIRNREDDLSQLGEELGLHGLHVELGCQVFIDTDCQNGCPLLAAGRDLEEVGDWIAVSSQEWVRLLTMTENDQSNGPAFVVREAGSVNINEHNNQNMRLDFLKCVNHSYLIGGLNIASAPRPQRHVDAELPLPTIGSDHDYDFLDQPARSRKESTTVKRMDTAPNLGRGKCPEEKAPRLERMVSGPLARRFSTSSSSPPSAGNSPPTTSRRIHRFTNWNDLKRVLDTRLLVPGSLQLWDVARKIEVEQEGNTALAPIKSVCVTGHCVFAGDATGHCSQYMLRGSRLQLEHRSRVQLGPVEAVDADERFCYSLGPNCHVSVWTRDLRRELTSFIIPVDKVRTITDILRPVIRAQRRIFGAKISRDGESSLFLAATSCFGDGVLLSWDFNGQRCNCMQKAHRGPIATMDAAPDGLAAVITSGSDPYVRLWDARDLSCLRSVSAGDSGTVAVAVGPSSRYFTLARDGCLKVWQMSWRPPSHRSRPHFCHNRAYG